MGFALINKADITDKVQTNTLGDHIIQDMNLIGGSWLTTLGTYAKNFAKGAWNVVKAAATNKSGFRDKLVDAYNGAGVVYGTTNVIGGKLDNHMPITGGKSIRNWASK
jgi:hypothetical protein